MMRRSAITLLVLGLSTVGAAQSTDSATEKEISALLHEYFSGTGRDALVRVAERLLHEKYQFVDNTGQRHSRSEAIARIKDPSRREASSITISDESISVTGNTAVATCRLAIRGSDSQGADFRSLTVWVKESAGWRLLARSHTMLPTP